MDDNNSTCGFCAAVEKWLNAPFSGQGTVVEWFLSIGLIYIAIFFWTRILARIA